ncbi:hypothetical protein [Bradyrhizobium sp. DASA03120]|uniref:hypothetical protein n=1 Tax=Bradyrhizobium sp. SMVTL-02 TaxID=3395917 RepID=UPI003F6F26E3
MDAADISEVGSCKVESWISAASNGDFSAVANPSGVRYRLNEIFSVDVIYCRNITGENANWITIGTTIRFPVSTAVSRSTGAPGICEPPENRGAERQNPSLAIDRAADSSYTPNCDKNGPPTGARCDGNRGEGLWPLVHRRLKQKGFAGS